MADRNMVKAQFQTGHRSIVPDRTRHSDKVLTTSEACRVLEDLQRDIESGVSDREIRSQAIQAISAIKSKVRSNASNGITGDGFGQSWDSKVFTVGHTSYRIDFEVSGDIKG